MIRSVIAAAAALAISAILPTSVSAQFAPGQPGQPGVAPPQPRQPFVSPGPLVLMTPEMGKRTAEISFLRILHHEGFGDRELGHSLNALKQIRELEKAMTAAVAQSLDEQKRVLLAAKPGGDASDETGPRLIEAQVKMARQEDAVWQALAQQIGMEKAGLLRQLTGRGSQGPQFPGGQLGLFPAVPNPFGGQPGFAPGGPPPPAFNGQPEQAFPQQPGPGGQPAPGFQPQGPGGRPNQPFPGQPGNTFAPPGPMPGQAALMMPGMAMMPVQDALDLIQAKLAAMRH